MNSLVAGGAEKHAISLLNKLDLGRFRLSAAWLKRDDTLLPQIDAQRCRRCGAAKIRKIDMRAVQQLAERLEALQIDVIVAVNPYSALYALLAQRRCRRPLRLVEIYHTTLILSAKERLQMWLYRRVLRRFDLLIYVCRNQYNYWAAGKGGMIKRITEKVSPRVFRVVALPAPSDRQKTQIYMQRYIEQLPAAGEIVIFDRSWYNRPGVERVMGYCTEQAATRFLQEIPHLESLLVESGITLLKYFLTVGEAEQERRFRQRIDDPVRQWKLSPMDLKSYRRWWDYTAAYDEMIRKTDTAAAPWWIVDSNDKKAARINCITHLLGRDPLREGRIRRAEARQAAEAPRGPGRGREPAQPGPLGLLTPPPRGPPPGRARKTSVTKVRFG